MSKTVNEKQAQILKRVQEWKKNKADEAFELPIKDTSLQKL